jgi:hypothetical protein
MDRTDLVLIRLFALKTMDDVSKVGINTTL